MVRSARPAAMAIVPWGVLVVGDAPKALRWCSIRAVQFDTVHGKDAGAPTTLYSVVLVQTEREELAGMAGGSVGLERLVAYLSEYQSEQARPIALDVTGARIADATEPFAEDLVANARRYLTSHDAVQVLGLPQLGYRGAFAPVASLAGLAALRVLLRGEDDSVADRRPFALVLAGELAALDLTEDVVALVQSPHPAVALAAKAAALRLGVTSMRAGTVAELDEFADSRDIAAFSRWSAEPLVR
jgi:hypothetical protein